MLPYGFRIVGGCHGDRRLVDHAAAFRAHCECDARAAVERECYLSAFLFGDDFRALLESTRTPKGFGGSVWSPWLWFDIDRETDLQRALDDARRLAASLVERYGIDEDELLAFYSGSKGFHVGAPSSLWGPAPSDTLHKAFRRLAETLAAAAGVTIDAGVYDRVRAFRAPNSRHPKTGRHKRRLSFDELLGLRLDAILRMAEEPAPFDVPDPPGPSARACEDWDAAVDAVRRAAEAVAERRATGTATLNAQTLRFIQEGAGKGDRHRLLFSAAANLGEFGCPAALAHALLTDAGRDSGLPPSEVRRQIDCGLAAGGNPA